MPTVNGVAGADIKRGDMVKASEGKFYPALSNERMDGVAAEFIPSGQEMYRGSTGVWRVAPPKLRDRP